MQWIVDHFYFFILALGIAHLCLLIGLWTARQRRARDLSFYLSNLVKHFSTSPDRHPGGTVHEQIDSFIADIREVIYDKERSADRGKLYYRLIVKDESKRDIQGTRLNSYNVARTGIEAYPLLGILGTIFAIALGLNAPTFGGGVARPVARHSIARGWRFVRDGIRSRRRTGRRHQRRDHPQLREFHLVDRQRDRLCHHSDGGERIHRAGLRPAGKPSQERPRGDCLCQNCPGAGKNSSGEEGRGSRSGAVGAASRARRRCPRDQPPANGLPVDRPARLVAGGAVRPVHGDAAGHSPGNPL